jgi:hypothetical protein
VRRATKRGRRGVPEEQLTCNLLRKETKANDLEQMTMAAGGGNDRPAMLCFGLRRMGFLLRVATTPRRWDANRDRCRACASASWSSRRRRFGSRGLTWTTSAGERTTWLHSACGGGRLVRLRPCAREPCTTGATAHDAEHNKARDGDGCRNARKGLRTVLFIGRMSKERKGQRHAVEGKRRRTLMAMVSVAITVRRVNAGGHYV